MNIIYKRTFWTITKGKSIGFIESSYKAGIVIHGEYITFRETSSNLSSSKPREINTRFLSLQDKSSIGGFMINKRPVCIYFKTELINNPLRSELFLEQYVTSICELHDETIKIKK